VFVTMYLEQRAYSEGRRCGLGSGNVTAHVGLKMRTKERLWISTRPARAVITISKAFLHYHCYFHTWAAPPMAFIFVKS
jgi:hypothetical protein